MKKIYEIYRDENRLICVNGSNVYFSGLNMCPLTALCSQCGRNIRATSSIRVNVVHSFYNREERNFICQDCYVRVELLANLKYGPYRKW